MTSERSQPPSDPVLDAGAVAQLRELDGGDGELLRHVHELFTRDSATRLESLRRAIVADDRASIAFEAHALKGAAANLGAADLTAQCAGLELDAPQGSLESLAAVVERLDAHLASVGRALAELAGRPAS